jgi:hypothetical protein
MGMASRFLLFDGQTGESEYSWSGIVTQRQQGLAIGQVAQSSPPEAADFRLRGLYGLRLHCRSCIDPTNPMGMARTQVPYLAAHRGLLRFLNVR